MIFVLVTIDADKDAYVTLDSSTGVFSVPVPVIEVDSSQGTIK